jgi:hypothetical protein
MAIATAVVVVGPASAANECAMRGQIDYGSDIVQVHEPSLTCNNAKVQQEFYANFSYNYTATQWGWFGQNVYRQTLSHEEMTGAKASSWQSGSGTYSSEWTTSNWYTWG